MGGNPASRRKSPKRFASGLPFPLNIVTNHVKHRDKTRKTPEIYFLRLEFQSPNNIVTYSTGKAPGGCFSVRMSPLPYHPTEGTTMKHSLCRTAAVFALLTPFFFSCSSAPAADAQPMHPDPAIQNAYPILSKFNAFPLPGGPCRCLRRCLPGCRGSRCLPRSLRQGPTSCSAGRRCPWCRGRTCPSSR